MKVFGFVLLTISVQAQNGIWTGYDWQNTDAGVGINNGVPYGLNNKVSIRLRSASTIDTSNINIYDQPNIKRIISTFSQENWNTLFPYALSVYTYQGFLQAAAKYPMFCNEYIDETQLDYACKKELATFFAHTTQETASFQFNREIYCYPTWNYGCDYSDPNATAWPPQPG